MDIKAIAAVAAVISGIQAPAFCADRTGTLPREDRGFVSPDLDPVPAA